MSWVSLESFAPADAQRLIEWIHSPRLLLQWSGPGLRYPLDATQLTRHVTRARQRGDRILRIVERGGGETLGYVELTSIDSRHGNAQLRRLLIGQEGQRGQGYGREAVRALLRLAFQELHLHRVELEVFALNIPAIRCFERSGFRREGMRREVVRFEGERWSTVWMGVLEHEWSGFER